jgi:hypothetical protein
MVGIPFDDSINHIDETHVKLMKHICQTTTKVEQMKSIKHMCQATTKVEPNKLIEHMCQTITRIDMIKWIKHTHQAITKVENQSNGMNTYVKQTQKWK